LVVFGAGTRLSKSIARCYWTTIIPIPSFPEEIVSTEPIELSECGEHR